MHDAYQVRSTDKHRTMNGPAGHDDEGPKNEGDNVAAFDIARLLPRWGDATGGLPGAHYWSPTAEKMEDGAKVSR
jgi:hypothetical protein